MPTKEIGALSTRQSRKNTRRFSGDTKRLGGQNYPCKILIQNAKQMQAAKTYPIRISVALPQEKNAQENPIEESLEVLVVPIFPGCIVSPGFRKIYVGSKFSFALFEITPLIPGKQIGKIEFSDPSSMLQSIKISFQVFSKWWEKIALMLSFAFFSLGVLSHSYQMVPCPEHWNFTYFLYQCNGLFYPCLMICILLFFVFLFFKQTCKEKHDSQTIEMLFHR
jgi:hypothetical protein